ncbi:MAG: MerR family transcriptional regulator [Myxococcota bacterium]
MSEATFTLKDLVAEVARALARNYEPAENGQVRAVPDERAIRYYTTLGLIDRPASLRGRTALYSARHVAQVVAIKRLQSAGRSLEEIQQLVPTLDDRALSRIAGMAVPRAQRMRSARADFWKADAQRATAESVPYESATADANQSKSRATPAVALTCNVALAPGVSVSFPAAAELSARDLSELAAAAEPLLSWISKRVPR